MAESRPERVALVTGAAGGIGRAVVGLLLARDPAASRATSISQHPLGRILSPAEIAEAIVFLASPAASGITGAILSVDGGYVAR